jgi:hypothetical protein
MFIVFVDHWSKQFASNVPVSSHMVSSIQSPWWAPGHDLASTIGPAVLPQSVGGWTHPADRTNNCIHYDHICDARRRDVFSPICLLLSSLLPLPPTLLLPGVYGRGSGPPLFSLLGDNGNGAASQSIVPTLTSVHLSTNPSSCTRSLPPCLRAPPHRSSSRPRARS